MSLPVLQSLQPPADAYTRPLPDFCQERAPEYFAAAGAKFNEPDPNMGMQQLMRSAMFFPGASIQVTYKNAPFQARFIPGHPWGGAYSGPSPAKIMVIGKVPGKEEAMLSRNLVGPSGKLLHDQLRQLQLNPNDWYVTNVVRFPLPASFSGVLPKPWVNECLPLLRMELAMVQPEYILCLGADSAEYVLGKKISVNTSFGSTFDLEYPLDNLGENKKNAKVIVCIHPAAVLRRMEQMPQLQASLQQFSQIISGKGINLQEKGRERYIIENEADLSILVDHILSLSPRMISIDAEWFGRIPEEAGVYLRCFQISWQAKSAAVVSLTHPGGTPRFEGNPFVQLKRLLGGNGNPPRIVGHNIKADLAWLQEPLAKEGFDILKAVMPADYGLEKSPAHTRYTGGIDTMLAMHAIRETGPFELESLAVQFFGIPRYDTKIEENLKKGIPHGEMSDEELYPYAADDADMTYRLAEIFNGIWNGPEEYHCVQQGFLDSDPTHRLNNRVSFWISMMAMPAFLEMEQRGIGFDLESCMSLHLAFQKAYDLLEEGLREEIHWPNFNINSVFHKRELLFGTQFNGKKPDEEGKIPQQRPSDGLSLNLVPIKSTGKTGMPWEKVISKKETHLHTPSTSRETLGIYGHTHPIVKKIQDLTFLSHALKTTLRKPHMTKVAAKQIAKAVVDDLPAIAEALSDPSAEDDAPTRSSKGLADYLSDDGRIHALFFPIKETGRSSCARPNLMAISKKRDRDYARLVGDNFRPMRSLFVAAPGHVLIESDFVGAELAVMAWLSNDEKMIEHVRRSSLPEDHPDYFDIHSSFVVEIFKLDLPPSKKALEQAGKKYLRDAIKCVVAGSRLHTDSGLLRIESLIGSHLGNDEAERYLGSVRVANHKTSTPIIGVYNGGLKSCTRVTTQYGYRLDSSDTHWYWTVGSDGSMVFKQAKDLRPGDVLTVKMSNGPFGNDVRFPRSIVDKRTSFKDVKFPKKFTRDWAAFLGLHLAEGSAGQGSKSFQLALAHENDPEFADKAGKLLHRLFGDRLVVCHIVHTEHQDQTYFGVASVKLLRWMDDNCPGYSHDKKIPEFVFQWPKYLIAELLRWMFEGDGSAKRNGRGFSITYSTASEQLARDVQLLLSQFGILSSVGFETRDGYDGRYWTVVLVSNQAREIFCKEIGFVTSAKNSRCSKSASGSWDCRLIPNQINRLKRLLPFVASPAKEKCRECLRTNSRVKLNRSRLKIILSNISAERLPIQERKDYEALADILEWDVSFQAIVSAESIGDRPVYDVQTTSEYDHLVSYNGILTHQTTVFGVPYGRGNEATARSVMEESGVYLTTEEIEKIQSSIFSRYPGLGPFLETSRLRAVSPGWLRDPFGGTRRFQYTTDEKILSDMSREAGNFKIQSTVARAMLLGKSNLVQYRQVDPNIRYNIVLQLHDMVLLETPVEFAEEVYKAALPVCLTDGVTVKPYDDDGVLKSTNEYHFALDTHIYERWGVDLTHDDCDRLSLPRTYGKAPKPKKDA